MNFKRDGTRLMTFGSRVIMKPHWAWAHLDNLANQLLDRCSPKQWKPSTLVSVEDGLQQIGGWTNNEIALGLNEAPSPRSPMSTFLHGTPNGSSELIKLIYVLCTLEKPELVVETGVAHGFSTAAILAALDSNAYGRLISIDLPHLHPRAVDSIGAAVPAMLRERWMLHLGPAAVGVKRILPQGECVDLFVQDASHTRRGQLMEYRAAWSHLKPRGYLVSDDAFESFEVFGREAHRVPVFIEQKGKARPIGVLRK